MQSRRWKMPVALALLLVTASSGAAQPSKGHGPRGMGPGGDPDFVADRELFHQLLRHRSEIRRDVKNTEHGIETLTESDEPKIAAMIQQHVASMKKRVEGNKPIHRRDPLFAEVFRHADKITFVYENTAQGVRVTETSEDPYVVKLIQQHAAVVSLFIKRGFEEVHRDHDVPTKAKEVGP